MFHFNNRLPFTRFCTIAVICTGCYVSQSQADATLVYETLDAEGAKTQHTFSITGRFVRIDTQPRQQPGYALFDTGRMIMFDVDETTHSYTPVKAGKSWHPAVQVAPADTAEDNTSKKGSAEPAAETAAEPAAEPAAETAAESAAATRLKATKKKSSVADKRCRMVLEIANDKQVAEHCMSGTGELGISTREMVTLSRLFTKADNLGLNLLGVATADESYASIQSKLADGKSSQTLKSVTKAAIPTEKMRIAEDYKLVPPKASKAP